MTNPRTVGEYREAVKRAKRLLCRPLFASELPPLVYIRIGKASALDLVAGLPDSRTGNAIGCREGELGMWSADGETLFIDRECI